MRIICKKVAPMSKPSDKKRGRRKVRERKVKRKKIVLDKKEISLKKLEAKKAQYDREFPDFRFLTNGAPEEFVELIRSAVEKIDFNNPEQFEWHETLFYKSMKLGADSVGKTMAKLANDNSPIASQMMSGFDYLFIKLADQVLSFLTSDQILQWFPYNDVFFMCWEKSIIISFRSLEKIKTDGGTLYYSRNKPKLSLNGREYIIGWSGHAIERVCQRLSAAWPCYTGIGAVFAFFDQCSYFELAELHKEQLAFTFYDECSKGTPKRDFVPEILGTDDDRDYYFRVGYCPAVIDGDFIKATSLLFPGYSNTPEYGIIHNSKLSYSEKQSMISRTRDLSWKELCKNKDYEILKWFHDNGIPQVIQSDEPLYSPPADFGSIFS